MTRAPAINGVPLALLRRRIGLALVTTAVVALAACSSTRSSPEPAAADAAAAVMTSETTAGSSSRARTYASLGELADDSDLVVVGTAQDQHAAADLPGTDLRFTLTDVATQDVLHGDVAAGATVVVRQTPLVDTHVLQNGDRYLLYLTHSSLGGEQADHYYVSGVTAGIYTADLADVAGSGYHRLDQDSGDSLPARLLTSDALD